MIRGNILRYNKKLFTIRLLLLLLILSATSINSKENGVGVTKKEILQNYLEAIGGKDAVQKLETKFCSGYLVKDVHWEVPPFDIIDFQTYADKTDDLSITFLDRFPESSENQNINSNVDESFENKYLDLLFSPQNYNNIELFFEPLTYVGIKKINNKKVYLLVAENSFSVHIDIENNLITSLGNYVEIKDYKIVDNVLTPHRIILSRKGGSYTYFIKNIIHNKIINENDNK